MKKLFRSIYFSMTVLLSVCLLTSCSDDGNTIYEDLSSYSVTISAEVSYTTATITFAPTAGAAGVRYAIGTENNRNSFVNGTYVGTFTNEGSASFTHTFSDLTTGSEYTVFARAYDEEGNMYTVSSIKVAIVALRDDISTTLQYVSDVTAGVTVQIDPNLFHRIDYYLGTSANREAFLNGTLSGITSMNDVSEYTFNYFNLTPSTDYVFFCKVYDRSNLLIETREVAVSTSALGEAPGIAEVSTQIDVYYGTYTFSPNANCSKLVAFVNTKGMFDEAYIKNIGAWSGNVKDMIISWNASQLNGVIEASGSSLTLDHTTADLLPGQEIEAYVLAYDASGNAALYHYEFSTPTFNNSLAAAVVDVEISDITSVGATYTFTASDNTVAYYYETIHADWYDALDTNDKAAYMLEYFTVYSYIPHHIPTGGNPFSATELTGTAGTRYYIGAIPINANGLPNGVGAIILKEFTTLSE